MDDNARQSELHMRKEQEDSEEEVGGDSEEVGSQRGNKGKKKPKNLWDTVRVTQFINTYRVEVITESRLAAEIYASASCDEIW